MDVFTTVHRWAGWLRHGGLLTARPHRGAAAVLAAVHAGSLFFVLGRSRLWSPLGLTTNAWLLAPLILLTMRQARLWGWGTSPRGHLDVWASMVPGVLGTAVAVVLDRFVNSVALLVPLASDPLGRGADLFGTASAPLYNDVLGGPDVHAALGLLLIVVGNVVGIRVLHERTALPRARLAGALLLAFHAVVASLLLTVR